VCPGKTGLHTGKSKRWVKLKLLWKNPNFDASRRANYYVRALETPTCRWSTKEAIRHGTPPRLGGATTLHERA
jgi:hypothetical protein